MTTKQTTTTTTTTTTRHTVSKKCLVVMSVGGLTDYKHDYKALTDCKPNNMNDYDSCNHFSITIPLAGKLKTSQVVVKYHGCHAICLARSGNKSWVPMIFYCTGKTSWWIFHMPHLSCCTSLLFCAVVKPIVTCLTIVLSTMSGCGYA